MHNSNPIDEAYLLYKKHTRVSKYSEEVNFAKNLLMIPMTNEHPPQEWQHLLPKYLRKKPDFWFYILKIWFIKSHISVMDIENSYPVYSTQTDSKFMLLIRYSEDKPAISFNIYKDEKGQLTGEVFFLQGGSSSAPLYALDYNEDRKWDYADVVAAREQHDVNK